MKIQKFGAEMRTPFDEGGIEKLYKKLKILYLDLTPSKLSLIIQN